MTIQEAIKSGKPFKRKHQVIWLVACWSEDGIYELNGGAWRFQAPADLVADDWEIKREPLKYQQEHQLNNWIDDGRNEIHIRGQAFDFKQFSAKRVRVTIEEILP